jgi:rhomboid family GlyGly-CTERM serine protease
MDPAKSQELNRRLPVVTLIMTGAGALLALFPACSGWLMYDRTAILSGQIWRLFTGHWVHFSTSQLGYDLLALAVAGWIAETQRLPRFGLLCFISPWLISGTLLLCESDMERFGGLSALATAVIVYTALHGLHDARIWRGVCAIALFCFCGKICYEVITGNMFFATVTSDVSLRVCAGSHLAGAMVAVLFYLTDKWLKAPSWRTACPARRWQGLRVWRRCDAVARP